jgi:hypothetical protein
MEMIKLERVGRKEERMIDRLQDYSSCLKSRGNYLWSPDTSRPEQSVMKMIVKVKPRLTGLRHGSVLR